jgi:diguanylate cyclase (GGDEF)-like protein/PAS domain S-box-containing protein
LNIIAWPSFTLFPLHLLLAVYLLRGSRHSGANRLFALINLLLGVWSLAHGLYVLAPERTSAWFYYRVATLAWLPLPAVIFHFLAELTDAWSNPRHRRTLACLLYAPVIALVARFLRTGTLLDRDIARGALGWYERTALTDPWAVAFLVLWSLAMIAGLGLVHRWQSFSNRRLENLQGRIIVFSGACSLAVALGYAVILPAVEPDCPVSTMSPLPAAAWIFGVWHAVVRYGLLRITPALAAENILQTMADALVITDDDQYIVRVNAALERLLNVKGDSLLRRPLGYALRGISLEQREWKRRLEQGELRNTEVLFRDANGRNITLVVSATKVNDARSSSSGYVVVLRDMTALKEAESRLQHAATHDPLTELPNRILFKDRATQAFARSRRNQTEGALLLLNLDGFKQINDTHGHEIGDEILRQIANRCTQIVRGTDTIARLDGDEFVVLLTDLKRSEDGRLGLQRLERALARPITLGETSFLVKVSIGMSAFPRDGNDLESLMHVADGAMCTAKEATKLTESAALRQATHLALDPCRLAANLPLALDRKQFELFFQPLHRVADAQIVGVEALLRWQHPEFGLIGPLQFLPLAERSDLILSIGAWVLRMACIQNKAWQTAGLLHVPVAVNVSAKQLAGADFSRMVRSVLDECDLDPLHLQIEISELAAVHDLPAIKESLLALSAMGVRIIVDDFGSGYSALNHLHSLSIHAVKISPVLIRNMAIDPRDAAIVRAMVSMVNAFGIQAIAKGVETAEQLEFLRNFHNIPDVNPACELVQGFVFSQPMPATELVTLLGTSRQPSSSEAVEMRAPQG